MKSDLDHLPLGHQHELERVRAILLSEFETALAAGGGGTQPWRRNGKILKLVLFGSYARNDWVDEPQNGYLSDYDLLVIVSHENLTDIAGYWYVAEDKMLRDSSVGRTVNIIVHTMAEVNQALGRGEYFWRDILRDGVILHELPGHPFAQPQPLSPREAYGAGREYFDIRFRDLDLWIEDAARHLQRSNEGQHLRKRTAFLLHQATETAYACFLLVHTFYFPRSHNIKFLRSLAEDRDQRLVAAWPREERLDRRRFELLKRAYVEARYSDQYDVNLEDLAALAESVARLRDLVQALCQERLEKLRAEAGA